MRSPTRTRNAVLLVLFLLVSTVMSTASDDQPADAFGVAIIEIDTPGPLGPISVFGDSVLLGSAIYDPTLPDHLAAMGWGPIRFVAGVGFNTGDPVRAPADARITTWIQRWRTQGWHDGPWVVNLGANDSVNCPNGDVTCMRNMIGGVLDALGPGTDVWWPMMTHVADRRASQDTFNTALAQLAAERDGFDTWDWPTEMRFGPYPSQDNIHLTPDGYRTRSARMAQQITARLAEGRPGGGPPVPLPAATAQPAGLLVDNADRLIDTRSEAPGRRPFGSVLRLDLSEHVPAGTTAVALYVTAVDTRRAGHLTVAPCDSASTASTVNFNAFDTRGAPTITQLGADGTVCVTVMGDAHLTVDLQGAFHPDDPAALGFDPIPVPQRLADTRETGRRDQLVLNAPSGARAVAVNLTSVGALGGGYVVASRCDATPEFANLNFAPGPAIAASAIVEVGDDGTFCVGVVNGSHVVVDLTGTFSASGALRVVPVVPTRMLDTRDGTGGWEILHGAWQVVRPRVAPPDAVAVTGTITMVAPYSEGYLVGWGCTGAPPTSSVNAGGYQVSANSLTTGIDGGRLCIETSAGTHTLFDTTAWWVPT